MPFHEVKQIFRNTGMEETVRLITWKYIEMKMDFGQYTVPVQIFVLKYVVFLNE